MTRIFFALLSILAIINTIYARSSLNDFLRRAIKGGVSYYLSNMGAISTDLMKDEDPKEECVFYVNSYQSTREKNAAIAFAAMRNRQLTASGGRPTANTLYDAFDLNLAFGDSGTLMREAMAGGPAYLRSYFKVTSGAYAQRCRGTVWLIVKKGAEIYHDAIWLTDEYPQLIRPGSGVTAIWEIDPAEIEAAIALDNPNHDLHPTPYRGGLPPGTRPPRSIEPITFDKKDVSSIQAKIDEYGRYPDVANGYLPSGGSSSPQCDMSDISRVPYNVFNGVFGTFCKNTLDNPSTISVKSSTVAVSSFGLSWSGGKGTCSLSCDEAFKAASNSPCGHTAGEQNIMTTSGTVEAGCGQYRWTIIKPLGTDPAPSAPMVSNVKCNAADQFGKHGDISPGFQNQYTGFACVGSARKTMKSGDPEVSFKTVTNGTPYNYKSLGFPIVNLPSRR
ncbi:hypothetical protein H4Q26_008222 [Puccinia striiformis f. sp. tritici PST-130]|nr:hypothetical protein H4Q26_008222 [Puccinia striiformis f. sp. tritici PST-130]